jgi:hypothetical protein
MCVDWAGQELVAHFLPWLAKDGGSLFSRKENVGASGGSAQPPLPPDTAAKLRQWLEVEIRVHEFALRLHTAQLKAAREAAAAPGGAKASNRRVAAQAGSTPVEEAGRGG